MKIKGIEITESLLRRFQTKVEKVDGCWVWTAGGGKYGWFQLGRNTDGEPTPIAVHHLIYELVYGPVSQGLQICHKCDNSLCVNPSHLFAGTQSDNQHDCCTKGRGSKQKLSIEEVKEIRLLYAAGQHKQVELAEMFGISPSNLNNIINRRKWGWVY